MCVRERERVCVCERERECVRERGCVCVRERGCVCVRERETWSAASTEEDDTVLSPFVACSNRLLQMPRFAPHVAGFRRAPVPITDLKNSI